MRNSVVSLGPNLLHIQHPLFTLNQDRSVQNKDIDYVKIHDAYASLDPRTYDSPRAQRLLLDTPPKLSQGTIPQENLYDIKTNRTGFYDNYQSIYGGDITYYTDIENDMPHADPPFSIPAHTEPTLLIDPMGGVRPYYLRTPIFEKNNFLYPYSFDQDQCEWREDLIALQQQKINSRQFGAFQFYNDPKTYYPSLTPDDMAIAGQIPSV